MIFIIMQCELMGGGRRRKGEYWMVEREGRRVCVRRERERR